MDSKATKRKSVGVGAPKGNQNARIGKYWTDAIRRVLESRKAGDKRLMVDMLANRLVDKAMEGDVSAMREIGDRIQGRPHQTISGPDDGPIQVQSRLVIEE